MDGHRDPVKGGTERIGLVGCVKLKRSHAAPAADLYTSALFGGRRRWVAVTCNRWFILSAKHGLVAPAQVLEPYDETLTAESRSARRAWAYLVLADLRAQVTDMRQCTFEIHAGAAYWDFGLRDGLVRTGARVEIPTEHLRQGEQLALYRDGPSDCQEPIAR